MDKLKSKLNYYKEKGCNLNSEEVKKILEELENKNKTTYQLSQNITNEEAEKVLKELEEVRPEMLNDKAKRLFEAIMTIADKKEEAESDLYEANNRIDDLLDIVKQKDKMIDLMVDEIYRVDWQSECGNSREAIKKYFEERCK